MPSTLTRTLLLASLYSHSCRMLPTSTLTAHGFTRASTPTPKKGSAWRGFFSPSKACIKPICEVMQLIFIGRETITAKEEPIRLIWLLSSKINVKVCSCLYKIKLKFQTNVFIVLRQANPSSFFHESLSSSWSNFIYIEIINCAYFLF